MARCNVGGLTPRNLSDLHCPDDQQFSVPGQCCKFCLALILCTGSDCHPNATCINLQTTYACHCNAGFTGNNGRTCTDIDECREVGAHHGHYCQAHTTVLTLWAPMSVSLYVILHVRMVEFAFRLVSVSADEGFRDWPVN
ncbi:Protocadherin Fat 4-like 3 [Homarus americanus]|uniref:Protocadherin Fat 4-like 3 n=1 Tax=Homarus americanus TaxID=6706 RepID=A0A8J5N9S1_HOMAM|nr:Protocadherin Fat 4-like 4 [Homarus americanus]KAG7175676.1 Protocadherin Fat 4-like 3 [Homarus americanus]